MRADVICRHVELTGRLLARSGGGAVGVNAEPFSGADYRRLRDAGVAFVALWQETYDREALWPVASLRPQERLRVAIELV